MAAPDDNRDLLDRATAALERIDATVARQAESFDRQAKSLDQLAARIEADRIESRTYFERLIQRIDRSEAIFVEAIGDIDLSIKRSNDRLDDMGAAIRANTQAVLSVLDRLGPATG